MTSPLDPPDRILRPAVRRNALRSLRSVAGMLRIMIDVWGERLNRGTPVRQLPENNAQAWQDLARDCDALIRNLQLIRLYAMQNYQLVKTERDGRRCPVCRSMLVNHGDMAVCPTCEDEYPAW